MANRQSVDDFLQRCEEDIRFAKEQLNTGRMQEHYNGTEYMDAQQRIEEAVNDLAHLALSCNAQQREQLHRMRLQLQQIQNDLTLDANIIQEFN
ncbi:YtzC family protein [Bacillus timonensis]|nr:YtzC family protein [Bacillus timonensis]